MEISIFVNDKYFANKGKELYRIIDEIKFARIPIFINTIEPSENIGEVFAPHLKKHLRKGDVVFVSAKAISVIEMRIASIDEIYPSIFSKIFCKFAPKSLYCSGLRTPEAMEMAVSETGKWNIIKATFLSLINPDKYYQVLGEDIRAIDGPKANAVPPYDSYIFLGSYDYDQAAYEISEAIGYPVAVLGVSNIGPSIIGTSNDDMDEITLLKILSDNPLGQPEEHTPCGIIRGVK